VNFGVLWVWGVGVGCVVGFGGGGGGGGGVVGGKRCDGGWLEGRDEKESSRLTDGNACVWAL